MSENWRDDPRFKTSVEERAKAEQKERETNNNSLEGVGAFFIIFIIGLLIYGLGKPVYKSLSGFFEDKADHKAYCQTHYTVTKAKTDFAAKQAYEKCMNG